MNPQYTYRVHYSVEDNEWVATCDQEPLYRGLGPLPEDALNHLHWVMDDSSPSGKGSDDE